MSTAGEAGLIIFLRNPQPGKVKTRLAATLGPEQALAIYKELTRMTLHLASQVSIPVYLFYEGGIPSMESEIASWQCLEQDEGDLGQKISAAFEYVFQSHHKAIIIGSDCPFLTVYDIHHTIDLLDTHEIVIGPSEDGGYYLLGCRELNPELYRDIQWGTSSVF